MRKIILSACIYATSAVSATTLLPIEDMRLDTNYAITGAEGAGQLQLNELQFRVLYESILTYQRVSDAGLSSLVQGPVDPTQVRAMFNQLRLPVTYTLTMLSRQKTIVLSFIQFSVLSRLFGSLEPLDVAEFPLQSRVNISAIVEEINSKAEAVFKRQIIYNVDARYGLNRASSSESAPLLAVKSALESGVLYRNKFVPLSQRQIDFVNVFNSKAPAFATYEDIGRAMTWTTGDPGPKSRVYVEAINLKSHQYAGAPLFKVVRGTGIRLTLATPPPPVELATLETPMGPLALAGNARLVYQKLIANHPDLSQIQLTIYEEPFRELGLSIDEIGEALSKINEASKTQLFGGILVPRFEFVVAIGANHLRSTWNASGSEENKMRTGRWWRPRFRQISGPACGAHLL